MARQDTDSARLEAFSDGVIAVIITIMVLELKVPQDPSPAALWMLAPVFTAYALSYFLVAVYWINHHYLFSFVDKVDTRILWANMFVLFSISLIPFATDYMGENKLSAFATVLYASTMLLCGLAFFVLRRAVARCVPAASEHRSMHRAANIKNVMAAALYAVAIACAYIHPAITLGLTLVVAVMYADPRVFVEKNPLA